MNRTISFGQYRAIDLGILSVLLVICQFLIHLATAFWYPEQLYVVSPAAAVTALVMMRWSGWAALPAALSGLVYVWLSQGSLVQGVVFTLGNLMSLAALPLLLLWGKENVRKDAVRTVVFGVAVQLLMQLGRAGLAAVLGYPAAACIGFITTDVLSTLFTGVVVWTVRRIEGLFEDQKHYLLRIQQEQQVERGEQI